MKLNKIIVLLVSIGMHQLKAMEVNAPEIVSEKTTDSNQSYVRTMLTHGLKLSAAGLISYFAYQHKNEIKEQASSGVKLLRKNPEIAAFSAALLVCGVVKYFPYHEESDLRYVYQEQGLRDYMEDTYSLDDDHCGGQILCVFDGHGGDAAAKMAAHNFSKIYREKLKKIKGASEKATFEEAFKQLHEDICKETVSGTTAVVAHISEGFCELAWVGDSRGLVSYKGKVFATVDHKPLNEKRIVETLGGTVLDCGYGIFRICNPEKTVGLAVGRSLGDRQVAPYMQHIPDYIKIPLTQEKTKEPNFIILATDGIWDVIDNEEALTLVKKALKTKTEKEAAQELVKLALKKGSSDNLTALIYRLT